MTSEEKKRQILQHSLSLELVNLQPELAKFPHYPKQAILFAYFPFFLCSGYPFKDYHCHPGQ